MPLHRAPVQPVFPIKLFVYGTLKNSFGNNHILKDGGAKFLCEGGVSGILLDLGAFPGYLHAYNTPLVIGEVWEIYDQKTLDRLDNLEGRPHLYDRMEAFITMLPRASAIEKAGCLIKDQTCHIYEYQHYGANEKSQARMCFPAEWSGKSHTTRLFTGFYRNHDYPVKTDVPAMAYISDTYSGYMGLIRTDIGEPVPGVNTYISKPHFRFNSTNQKWEITGHTRTPPPAITYTPPPPEPVMFKDDLDPGEEEVNLKEAASG